MFTTIYLPILLVCASKSEGDEYHIQCIYLYKIDHKTLYVGILIGNIIKYYIIGIHAYIDMRGGCISLSRG